MEVQVNGVGVLLATLSSMVVGSIWYSKATFGKTWMKLVGLTDEKMKEGGWLPMLGAIVRALLTAYVLAHVIFLSHTFFNNSFLEDALMTGFWVYVGFVGSTMLMHDAFEQRRKKLSLINASHEFVTIMVMALVIGLVGL